MSTPLAKEKPTARKKYEAVIKQWIGLRKQRAALTKPMLKEFARQLFSKFSDVNSFAWYQFNNYDCNEPPVFDVQNIYINGQHLQEWETEDEEIELMRHEKAGQRISEILDRV